MDLTISNKYPRLQGVYDDKFITLFILRRYRELIEDENIFGPLRSGKGFKMVPSLVMIPSLVMFMEDPQTQATLDNEAREYLGYDLDIDFLKDSEREKVYMESEGIHADFHGDFYRVMKHYRMCHSINGSYDLAKKELRNTPFLEVW